ncbi:hypothetical protein ACU4GD_07690 [Cupriavidus basilensis]
MRRHRSEQQWQRNGESFVFLECIRVLPCSRVIGNLVLAGRWLRASRRSGKGCRFCPKNGFARIGVFPAREKPSAGAVEG